MAKSGDVIAGYPLGQPLGQGALGQVFVSEHPRSARRVAVRLLASVVVVVPEVADKVIAGLRAVNGLPLPAVLGTLDCGKTPDGGVFVISDYLNGEPLPEHLARSGPMMPEEAIALTLQIASSLAVAESKKIFHHDLKPRKLTVLPDPGAPFGKRRVVLRDLGYPRTGPDLLEAKLDVLRLGGCLFMMLTGRPPALSMREAMSDLAQSRPGLPPLLTSLLGNMLTADDAVRPLMGQAAERLRALLPGGTGLSTSQSARSSASSVGRSGEAQPEAPGANGKPGGRKEASPAAPARPWLAFALGGTVGAGAAALLTFSLLSHGRGVSDLMARRVLAAPSTLALCHGTVLAPPTRATEVPPRLASVAGRLNLVYWSGECFQPTYLGPRDLVYGDSAAFASADEPAGLLSQADGHLVISSSAGGGVRLVTPEGKAVRELLRQPRLPGFAATDAVHAGPVAVDSQGAFLFTASAAGKSALFWARGGGALQRLYDVPGGVVGLQVPAFDAERAYVAAGSRIGRHPLVAGAAPIEPWFLLEGAVLRGALPLSAGQVVITISAEVARGGEVSDRAVTLLFDLKERGYYLLAEEDLGPLAQRADGALWRYDSDKRALRLLRIEAPR